MDKKYYILIVIAVLIFTYWWFYHGKSIISTEDVYIGAVYKTCGKTDTPFNPKLNTQYSMDSEENFFDVAPGYAVQLFMNFEEGGAGKTSTRKQPFSTCSNPPDEGAIFTDFKYIKL